MIRNIKAIIVISLLFRSAANNASDLQSLLNILMLNL